MNNKSYKQRLTGVGCWGVGVVVVMVSFGSFFYGIHYYYDINAIAYTSQDMVNLAAQAGWIAAISAGGAFVSWALAIAGAVMIWIGRENYVSEAQTDLGLPNRGLRDLCSAA